MCQQLTTEKLLHVPAGIASKWDSKQQGVTHLVGGREVNLGSLDPGGGCAPCDLQHPGGRVVTPLDGSHPLETLQVIDQVAALMPQHAKVCQLHQVPQSCSANKTQYGGLYTLNRLYPKHQVKQLSLDIAY